MEAAALPRQRTRRWTNLLERQGFLASILIAPAVAFIGLLVGGPLLLALYLSLTDATAGQLSGKWVGLGNFRDELRSPIFRGAVWHTFLFTVISQVIVVVVAGFLAHALVRSFRGKWILRALILLPWAAPVALTTVAFLWFFDPTFSIFTWILQELHLASRASPPNWLGTPNRAIAAVIAVHAWRIIPFATVIFLAGIASIPKEVDDAAAIDGATGLKKFWYVSLPLQLPIAIVTLLFGIVFTATDIAVVQILTNGGPFNSTNVLTTWAYQTGIESGSLGQGAAIAVFLVPVLAIVAVGMLIFARRVEVS